MKKILFLFFYLILNWVNAQAPANYYNTAIGTGYTLKTNLKKIIDNNNDGIISEHIHSDQGYGALWTLYSNTAFRDNYYENNGSLLDIYSENPSGTDLYEYTTTGQQCGTYTTEGDCYNREHLVAQCFFDNYATAFMRNDPFHVVPSDGEVNNQRGNFPFGNVNTVGYTSSNGSKRGSNLINSFSNYSGTVFEPLNEFKGDIARAFFYFVTRYEENMDEFYTAAVESTCKCKNMFDGSINQAISSSFLLNLIKWHKQDPVSAKEIAYNNAIYNFQNNRNPFIDNPDYVCQIWTTQCSTVDSLLSEENFDANIVSIYPNPSNGLINIETQESIDSIVIYNFLGQKVSEFNKIDKKLFQLSIFTQGIYQVKITTSTKNYTKKILIN